MVAVAKREKGEKVLIKSYDWYNSNKNSCGEVRVRCGFISEMKPYLGKTGYIRSVHFYNDEPTFCYKIDIDTEDFWWSDDMFEDIQKIERLKKLKKLTKKINKTKRAKKSGL